MYIVDSDNAKRGPLEYIKTKHHYHYSPFHSESAFCGTCHDVSNPVFDRQADDSYTPNTLVYPNPSEGIFYFNLPEQLQGSFLQLSLLDLNGRYILSLVDLPQASGQASIDLSFLEPGLYTYILLNSATNRLFRGQIIIR